MGVYIKGMKMPKDEPQLLWVYPNGKALTVQSDVDPWKELQAVPVPPHGRLIDADALEKDIDKYIGGEESRSRFHHWVQVQSVVIPGNKGEQR